MVIDKCGDINFAECSIYDDMQSESQETTENRNESETSGRSDNVFDRDNPELQQKVIETLEIFQTRCVKNDYNADAIRGQVDTGAKVSVTNMKHLLHKYYPYKTESESPVRLTGVVKDGKEIIPEGVGYLRIPANTIPGYIDIMAFYSPHLSSTLISETGIMAGSMTKAEMANFSGQSLLKFFDDDEHRIGRMFIVNHHKRSRARDIVIEGVIIGGQYYTDPLILPERSKEDPDASVWNCLEHTKQVDKEFKEISESIGDMMVDLYKVEALKRLDYELTLLPEEFLDAKEEMENTIMMNVPIMAIKSRTEKMLWHQRLGHPCDEYLYNAHKYIIGIPKFDRETPVLDQCPTCIQAKQSKEPAGPNSIRKATIPYQGLSIDFSFSGTRSRNDERRVDYEGLNGETCYILITDHASGMKHGDTRVSKAPPIEWLRRFLSKYSPDCEDKYVYLDQGGELYKSPAITKLLSEAGYDIFPTGADNSRQNGTVERAHKTIGNSIRSFLSGAGLEIKFWPYAFYHALRVINAIPEKGRDKSPIEITTGKQDNFTSFRTFGCRVWVRPPGGRLAKYKPNSRKGIFLGYMPHTTRNILWYDLESKRVKIASHAKFDEGMNDLPVSAIPPNVQQLQRSDEGLRPTPDLLDIHNEDLQFYTTPFPDIVTTILPLGKDNKKLGFDIRQDLLSNRAYISDIHPQSHAASIHSSLKATRKKLKGAYFFSINGDPVFTPADVEQKLSDLRDQGVEKISIELAPATKLNTKQLRRAAQEFGIGIPTKKHSNKEDNDRDIEERTPNKLSYKSKHPDVGKRIAKQFDEGIFFGTINEYYKEGKHEYWHVIYDDDDEEDLDQKEVSKGIRLYHRYKKEDENATSPTPKSNISSLRVKISKQQPNPTILGVIDDLVDTIPSMDTDMIRAIARIRSIDLSKGSPEAEDFSPERIPIELVETVIYAIQSQSITEEEQALGYFTRKKLKGMKTWKLWREGETKQLNQFHDLGMFGDPVPAPKGKNTIILRAHWQYNIKRNGTRRSRLCCNGSKKAAPLLHAIASTYSSCVEHPVQRLFLAIAASLNLKVYGGDAKDAYGHSPGPERPTYMYIDDAYADWYEEKFKKKIDRNKVLPVLKALQGHPESGRLWEQHISRILKDIGFKSTTHDKTIYRMSYEKGNGENEMIYMLRQVDDFAIACTDEKIAVDIYDKIGTALKTAKERDPPFAYLGLISDFNGVDISQTKQYIEISCTNYIDRVLKSHGWETDVKDTTSDASPMSKDALEQVFKQEGPKEGTQEHSDLEEKAGFGYRTLLGELMFCYISCRCDIGYAITLLSKFSTAPSAYHYRCLKNVARYLRTTKKWGIRYKRNGSMEELPEGDFSDVPKMETDLPEYPEDITKNKLICFVDAAYANDLKKRRSTTVYVFTYSGGAIVYRSKAQSITALSSTEAELVAAVY